MTTLALATCGPELEVALAGDPLRGTSLVRLAGRPARSRLVLAAVDLLLEDAGISPDRLEEVLVTRGPGSFTGIRAGLATAQGLCDGCSARAVAYDSLLAQAARVGDRGTVWAAQPGRRGEVYARRFEVGPGSIPRPLGEVEVRAVDDAAEIGPWVAAGALELGGAARAGVCRAVAEALLELRALGATAQPLEPVYVEGPPIGGGQR